MKHLGTILLGLAGLAAVFGGNRPAPPPDTARAGSSAPAKPVAMTAPPRAGAPDDAISIDRDASGQFHLQLAVNNTPTRFLVDTGADVLALTEADAARAGIPVDPSAFRPILQTASGPGWGAPVRLDRLEIGRSELREVDAVIVRDLSVSLLGQSVLRRIGKVELQGDQIVLQPGT